MFGERRVGWIGVDVGTTAVKLAQVERAGRGWRLVSGTIIQDADRRPLDGGALSDSWWAEAIRGRVTRRGGFRGRSAACVLSMARTDSRVLELPDGTDAERRAMIEQELEAGPGGAAAVTFDFWGLPPSGPNREAATKPVHVLTLARDVADGVGQALRRGGLACEALDGLPTVLARAALMSEQGVEGPRGILDWGSSSATLVVADATGPLFARQLRDCGLSHLVGSLVDGLGLTPPEVHQMLVTHGLPGPRGQAGTRAEFQKLAANLASVPFGALVEELRKTLAYLKQQRRASAPSELRLVGGGSVIANVGPYLAGRIELPVEPWRLGPDVAPQTGGAPAPQSLLAGAAALSALAWES